MKSWRENPDGAENAKATKQIEREIGALKLQAQSEEIACPNCYGGHFRPCQWCGDTGRVTNIPNTLTEEERLEIARAEGWDNDPTGSTHIPVAPSRRSNG